MLERKARARAHLHFKAKGNGHGKARRHRMSRAGGKVEIFGRHHIHASAQIAQQFQHREVGERLDRKADVVGKWRQRLGKQLVMAG